MSHWEREHFLHKWNRCVTGVALVLHSVFAESHVRSSNSVTCAPTKRKRILPYALKFSWDKTFAVFAVWKTTVNILIHEYFEQLL